MNERTKERLVQKREREMTEQQNGANFKKTNKGRGEEELKEADEKQGSEMGGR